MNFESTKKKIKEESFDLDILDYRTMLSTLENLNKAYLAVLVTVSGIREKFMKDFLRMVSQMDQDFEFTQTKTNMKAISAMVSDMV